MKIFSFWFWLPVLLLSPLPECKRDTPSAHKATSYPEGNQIVFNHVGIVANSIEYLHVLVPRSLKKDVGMMDDFIARLTELLVAEEKVVKNVVGKPAANITSRSDFDVFEKSVDTDNYYITLLARKRIIRERESLMSLLSTLPSPSNTRKSPGSVLDRSDLKTSRKKRTPGKSRSARAALRKQEKLERKRNKRQIAAGFAGFLAGSILGIIEEFQILDLNNRLGKVENTVNGLIDVTQLQGKAIHDISKNVQDFESLMIKIGLQNHLKIVAFTADLFDQVKERREIITETIAFAQLERLSPRALSNETLSLVFDRVFSTAKDKGCVLFFKNPNGLFQVDTSFAYNAEEMEFNLILHVPMIPVEHQLHLKKYVPFPLVHSFSFNSSIIPLVGEENYLAVNDNEQYRILSHSDLNSCSKKGIYYLCDERNTLRDDLTHSCLGSLYKYDPRGIDKFCTFEISPLKEHVSPIGPGNWLISTPEKYSATIKCRVGGKMLPSGDPVQIRTQTVLELEEGCELQLKENFLSTDTNTLQTILPVRNDIEFDASVVFDSLDPETVRQKIKDFRANGLEVFNNQDLQFLKLDGSFGFIMTIATGAVTLTGIFGTMIVVIVLWKKGFLCCGKKTNTFVAQTHFMQQALTESARQEHAMRNAMVAMSQHGAASGSKNPVTRELVQGIIGEIMAAVPGQGKEKPSKVIPSSPYFETAGGPTFSNDPLFAPGGPRPSPRNPTFAPTTYLSGSDLARNLNPYPNLQGEPGNIPL